MIWFIIIGGLSLLVLFLVRPIKNEYGTFGDDDYDYEQEARDKGWID